MKKIKLFFISLLAINAVFAQDINIPKTDFYEQNPYSLFLETISGLNPNEFKGRVKTVSMVTGIDYPEIDKYISYTTKHYFNKKRQRNLTTLHTLEYDCCGDEVKNSLDTIYPNLKINVLDKQTIEVINIGDNSLKTTYSITGKKVNQYITKYDETYLNYNKKGELISRTGYQIINEDEKNTTYKYNNLIENAFYYSRKLIEISKKYYHHPINIYGESNVIYTYNTKGKLIQKQESWTDYYVKGFNFSELLLKQNWSDKKTDGKNKTQETFEYNTKGKITKHITTDNESTFEDKITYYPEHIEIEVVAIVGTEKPSIIEKQFIKLDFNNNPTEVKILTRDDNGNFIEANKEIITFKYEYYK
ncbi:MAG: hypothetical protein ABJL44_18365 [Algibacter sp.]